MFSSSKVLTTTILNVDDYLVSREALSQILKLEGYSVIEAENGAEALRHMKNVCSCSTSPDLVLLDVMLPDISGYEVCQRLKQDSATAAIPVLMISGAFDKVEDRARGLDSGADGYLTKPVETAELIATINALLRMRQAEKQAQEARVEAEAARRRYRDLVDDLDAIVWEADVETRLFTYVSKRAEKMLGYPIGRWLNEPNFWNSVVHPDDREYAVKTCREAIAEASGNDFEYRAVTADGRTIWLRDIVHAVRDDQGHAKYLRGVMVDTTSQRKAEEALLEGKQEAHAQAEAVIRMKDEFLATASHELRAPLHAILGWTKLLRGKSLSPDEAERALETIERAALAQSRVISDLLDTSQVITGKLRLNVRLFDPIPIIETAIEIVRLAAEAKGVSIESAFDASVGEITGDPDRLQQIIWNLVSNAVKFTPRDGNVKVTLERRGPNLEEVEIVVQDTGAGIKPEFLPYVFDPFRQADGSRTRKYGGLGLGLAIVRRLAELHGGAALVESPGENQGATFTVRLPAISKYDQAENAFEAPTPLKDHDPELERIPKLEGMRILVVDDEPDCAALTGYLLSECGADVKTVVSALEALDVIEYQQDWRPDILVSDIQMPDVDGYALMRRVRELEYSRGGNIPAIALTAHTRAEDRIRALAAGFQIHVAKPVEPTELLTVVESLANRPVQPLQRHPQKGPT
ncbi:MAG: response regulator [Blastocatellales bacterium]